MTIEKTGNPLLRFEILEYPKRAPFNLAYQATFFD